MQTVVELPQFISRAKACKVSDGERFSIIDYVSANPQCGDEMPGTGGARKVRFARPGQGKRGSYRVITFYSGKDIPGFLLSMFAKNEKSDMSKAEKNELKTVFKAISESSRSHKK